MNRRDRILALALPKQNKVTISPPPETAHKSSPLKTAIKPAIPETVHEPPPPDTAHERSSPEPVNMPSCPDNSEPDTQIPPFHDTCVSLMCYETMPSDDEENNESADVDFYEDSDDSVKDQNYEPPTQRKKKKYNFSDTVLQSTQENSAPMSVVEVLAEVHEIPVDSSLGIDLPRVQKTVFPETPSDEIEVVEEQVEDVLKSNSNTDALPEIEENYTKSGALRKRRKFKTPLSQRVQEKKQRDNEKLNLKEPCTEKCRKKCTTKISQEERKNIHDRFVNLNFESRGLFIKGLVEPENVKTRTVKEDLSPKRNISYKYKFFVNNEKVEVCKTYFLTTLGYNPQNNTHLHKVLQKPVDEQMDKRGSYERKNVIDKDEIIAHIKSYNPVVSHYRREHAPLKLYLPSDITITSMHQNFTETYPNKKISFETYRRVLRELNISFARLGNEECEQCALFKSHEDSNECNKDPSSCEKCLLYHKHNFKYKTSREAYKADVNAALTDKDTVYYSVDLQKVIMIPRMDQYKIAIFCPRIIAFNESFVPLGKTRDDKVPYAVLWNETISGRNLEDILSAFRSFLLHKRDAKHVVLWADNCAAQNKNWAFMCFLVNMVNSELTATEVITVKYFEPGHTFMSADHFHHQVEMSLKKKNKVYDFDDFVDAVRISNSGKNTVHVMSVSDFFTFEDSSSQHKIRNIEPRIYLRDIMSVKAEKGHYTIKFKENLESEWKELDFLQVKVKKNKAFPNAVSKSTPRGITKERKEEILAKLVPLMPENRRHFWTTLPESTKAHSDLATEN